MVDQNQIPEGTDSILAGAGTTDTSAPSSYQDTLIEPTQSSHDKLTDKVRSSSQQLTDQAADKAKGLVDQGLSRSSEALGSVSKLVGDTATSLDDRLGQQYGDYARKAAGAIEDAANKLSTKNADALVDDTRDFVRKSPGIALAGAAIVGFALARILKSSIGSDRNSKA